MDGGSQPEQIINPGDEEDTSSEEVVHATSDDLPEEDFSSTARKPTFHQDVLDTDQELVHWTASEFVEHQKSTGWFILLGLVTLVFSSAVYFLTKEWFAVFIAVLLAVIFGIGAARRPRVLDYAITTSGISIDQKHYPFESFRSFGIVNEGPIESIVLLPSKRWNPAISLYFAPDDGDEIVDALGSSMPFEERELGLADRFLHKIRF